MKWSNESGQEGIMFSWASLPTALGW